MAPVRLPIASLLTVGSARVAQSEERLTRNEQVRGSNPRAGSWRSTESTVYITDSSALDRADRSNS